MKNKYYFCFRVKKNEHLILERLEEVRGKSGRAEGGISKYIRDLILDDILKQTNNKIKKGDIKK